jgi:hypothetical protein
MRQETGHWYNLANGVLFSVFLAGSMITVSWHSRRFERRFTHAKRLNRYHAQRFTWVIIVSLIGLVNSLVAARLDTIPFQSSQLDVANYHFGIYSLRHCGVKSLGSVSSLAILEYLGKVQNRFRLNQIYVLHVVI